MLSAGQFILRPYSQSDAVETSAAVRESTQTIGRWMPWAKPDFSDYDAACWFAHCSQSRASGAGHEFGIFTPSGEFVGGCGLNQFYSPNKHCNHGYWVRQSRQRTGAATAAVLALRDLGLHRLGLARIEIVVAEGNIASVGVARKAGATYECLAQARFFSSRPRTPRCWELGTRRIWGSTCKAGAVPHSDGRTSPVRLLAAPRRGPWSTQRVTPSHPALHPS